MRDEQYDEDCKKERVVSQIGYVSEGGERRVACLQCAYIRVVLEGLIAAGGGREAGRLGYETVDDGV